MIRRFKELDGTLDNVAQRITDDYTYSLGDCSTRVGAYATQQLSRKLQSTQFETLGFTEDTLTLPLGEVEFSDESKVTELFNKISYDLIIDPSTDLAFLTGTESHEADILSNVYAKANMHKAQLRNSEQAGIIKDTNNKKYRMLLKKAGKLTTVDNMFGIYDRTLDRAVLRPLSNKRSTLKAFHTNTPCEDTHNMKPSKWLAKYIERLIPGITAEYSALLSVNKKYNAYLTIDPTIMLNCSESATFSSCFRFEGEYHFSAQRFMNGLHTAMLVAFDGAGRINYRCWTMIKEDRSTIVTLRSYADIPPNIIGAAMKKRLRTHVLATDDYEKEDFEDNCQLTFEPDGDSYIDPGYVAYVGKLADMWHIDSGDAIDPADGCVTDEAELNSTRCQSCDDRTHVDELWTVMTSYQDTEQVCCYCCENNFTLVNDRDEYHHNDYVVRVNNGDYVHEDDLDGYVAYGDEYYPVDDCTETAEGEYIPDEFVNDEHVLIDDTYYHIDNVYYSDMMDEWYTSTDDLETAEADEEEEIA